MTKSKFSVPTEIAHMKIERIRLYRIDVDVARHFSFGVWNSRQHGFVAVAASGKTGWGEEVMSLNEEHLDLGAWAAGIEQLQGMTVSDALVYVHTRQQQWGARKCEMLEMALLDLIGKLAGVPTLELLGLPTTGAVPGLYCVLERDPERVRQGALLSLEHHYSTHLKLKLYGDSELDGRVVRTAREVMGDQAYLVGDVNTGYRTPYSPGSIDEVVEAMKRLADSGLNACEDPACLDPEQWIELQEKSGSLDIIPDYPMRPASKAIETIRPGMGRIYNIHPGSAGSLLDAIQLADRIRLIGGKLMIGDNSLIGPACSVWQQLAIGLKAEWVEALEKPAESGTYDEVLLQTNIARREDGRLIMGSLLPGFGTELDEEKLSERCVELLRLA